MADELRVWAPRASRVEVEVSEVGGERRTLTDAGGGWWTLGAALPPGTDYGFVLDGDGPFPDPRSRWQPRGVHGPSRIDDPRAFRWTDGGWTPPSLEDAVIYELHPGTFTDGGTFDSAIERLDALVELGVTHVELLPVAESSGERGWGYDGVDLWAPHHAQGGPAALRRLVDACHARGLGALLDVVYNHFGPEGNYLPRFGPYLSEDVRTPWGAAVNLDGEGSAEVRRYFLDNAAMWLTDFHLDGLRVDAVHALTDRSPEHLLAAMARETADLSRRLGRRVVLIAETNRHDPRTVTPRAQGGHGFDAQWCDDLHHALHVALTSERRGYYAPYGTIALVAGALVHGWLDHDLPDARPPTGTRALRDPSPHRFLGYLQNHDQVGNRAQGERLHHLVGVEATRAVAALVLCAPFVPMLFQGEEWAASTPWLFFCDHGDAWLRSAVREGRWREFGEPAGLTIDALNDPSAPASLERSRLRWAERHEPEHARMLAWYRDLLRLRRERLDLRAPERPRVRFDEDRRWLVLERARTAVLVNLDSHAQPLPRPDLEGARVLLASRDGWEASREAFVVPGHAAVVLGV